MLGHITTGLDNGFMHPFLGPDHLLAMVAVGILAVTLKRALLVPATFVVAMVVGGALGMTGVSLPLTETTIVLSVVALGGALVAGQLVRPEVALGLVAIAGIAGRKRRRRRIRLRTSPVSCSPPCCCTHSALPSASGSVRGRPFGPRSAR